MNHEGGPAERLVRTRPRVGAEHRRLEQRAWTPRSRGRSSVTPPACCRTCSPARRRPPRAAAAGEARDAYESALRHLERVRGTPQEWELRALANEVEEMLAREEGDQTCPGR